MNQNAFSEQSSTASRSKEQQEIIKWLHDIRFKKKLFGGDVLDFSEEGVLTVNGTVQAGEIVFPTYPPKDWEGQFEVPADSVFVLGDYRTQTEDSRDFGCIALEDIEGKAITMHRRSGGYWEWQQQLESAY